MDWSHTGNQESAVIWLREEEIPLRGIPSTLQCFLGQNMPTENTVVMDDIVHHHEPCKQSVTPTRNTLDFLR